MAFVEGEDESGGFESDLVNAVPDIVPFEIISVAALEEVHVGLHPDLVTHGFARSRLVDDADAEFIFGSAPDENLAVNPTARILVHELLGSFAEFFEAGLKGFSAAIEFPRPSDGVGKNIHSSCDYSHLYLQK